MTSGFFRFGFFFPSCKSFNINMKATEQTFSDTHLHLKFGNAAARPYGNCIAMHLTGDTGVPLHLIARALLPAAWEVQPSRGAQLLERKVVGGGCHDLLLWATSEFPHYCSPGTGGFQSGATFWWQTKAFHNPSYLDKHIAFSGMAEKWQILKISINSQ